MQPNSTHLFIISAPSGGGKTTLCREVRRHFPDMLYSVSYTTRKPRKGEQDGIDYHFIDKNEFKIRIDHGKWAEWARVHGNYYGTDATFLDEGLHAGHDTNVTGCGSFVMVRLSFSAGFSGFSPRYRAVTLSG